MVILHAECFFWCYFSPFDSVLVSSGLAVVPNGSTTYPHRHEKAQNQGMGGFFYMVIIHGRVQTTL
jgi:hypothetical protein